MAAHAPPSTEKKERKDMKTRFTLAILAAAMAATASIASAQTTTDTAKLPVYPTPDMKVEDHNEWTRGHYPKKIAEFKANPLSTNDIVFIGDSITEKGNDWGKRFGSDRVRNRLLV